MRGAASGTLFDIERQLYDRRQFVEAADLKKCCFKGGCEADHGGAGMIESAFSNHT
ncbi:MAG: hypothetical protein ACT6RN_25605 [Agrobacterium sp.]|uniref:hypothetical protein n=1 Tax=Agrobacterium sp. TaxID=361 RepID=UPI004037FEFD